MFKLNDLIIFDQKNRPPEGWSVTAHPDAILKVVDIKQYSRTYLVVELVDTIKYNPWLNNFIGDCWDKPSSYFKLYITKTSKNNRIFQDAI